MTTTPNHLQVELEETDVNKDLISLLDSMTSIREETIKNQSITKEQNQEYFHLTYRLASVIEALADDDLWKAMQDTADVVNSNHLLLTYDPLQDGHWKKEPNFSTRLERILIHLTKDNFQNIEHKHHLFQALKFLAGANDPKQEEVYKSIAPFQSSVPFVDEGARTLAGFWLGHRCQVEADGLTLKVNKGNKIYLNQLLEIAANRGFTKLQLDLPRDQELIHSLNQATIIDLPEKQTSEFWNTVYRFAPFTELLGLLPQNFQQRLEKKIPSYNAKKATFKSSLVELTLGAAIAIAPPEFNLGYLACPIFVDGAIRLMSYLANHQPVGSLFLKPFLYYFEQPVPEDKVKVEIHLQKKQNVAEFNASNWYEQVARQRDISPTAPNQKIHSDENTTASRKVYRDSHQVGPYCKDSFLVIQPEGHYILNFVLLPEEKYFIRAKVETVLGTELSPKERVKKLTEELPCAYLHYRFFQQGEKVIDLEATEWQI